MMRMVILAILCISTARAEVAHSNLSADVFCMAQNIYHEARNQSVAGQYAVGLVVLNRKPDGRFPHSVCGVTTQGQHKRSWRDKKILVPIRNRCHFSWYCDGISDAIHDMKRWKYIVRLSKYILSGKRLLDITDGATHYHATYILPDWAESKTETARIDDHIFYRWEKRAIDIEREKILRKEGKIP